MVPSKPRLKQDLAAAVAKAVEFHGHLGPFLVVGVRMGILGLRQLEAKEGETSLRATVSVKPSVPFSCVIDGVQVTTKCTVGNGKLKLKNSPKEISTIFEVLGGKRVTVTLTPDKFAELRKATERAVASEKLEETARVYVSMPDEELFTVQK